MTKISNFWNWFKKNNKEYTSLNAVDEAVKGKLPDELLEQLHKYCDGLYFEIGGFPGEDQELIITAEGDRTYFDKVEELILAAPQMEGWTFVAFKPATNEHFNSTWGDIELNTEDMWFLPLTNDTDSELGIRVFLKNHESIKDNETLTPLLYKMLDTIVGEKVFALDIH